MPGAHNNWNTKGLVFPVLQLPEAMQMVNQQWGRPSTSPADKDATVCIRRCVAWMRLLEKEAIAGLGRLFFTSSQWQLDSRIQQAFFLSRKMRRFNTQPQIPSGKHTKSYWKWPIYSGFSHEQWIKMVIFHGFPWFFVCLPEGNHRFCRASAAHPEAGLLSASDVEQEMRQCGVGALMEVRWLSWLVIWVCLKIRYP